jgi:hypothetical protein
MNFAITPTRPMRAIAVQRSASQSVLRSAFHGVPVHSAAPSSLTIGISNGTEMSTTAVRSILPGALSRLPGYAGGMP